MKTLRLAAVLIVIYIFLPAALLGGAFSRPEELTSETLVQFITGILLFSIMPHAPACLVLFIMMASKGIHDLTSLREQKGVFWAAVLVLVAHLGLAILMGGKPVEFGMLVNFFLVPLLGAVAIVSGIIIGRVLAR